MSARRRSPIASAQPPASALPYLDLPPAPAASEAEPLPRPAGASLAFDMACTVPDAELLRLGRTYEKYCRECATAARGNDDEGRSRRVQKAYQAVMLRRILEMPAMTAQGRTLQERLARVARAA